MVGFSHGGVRFAIAAGVSWGLVMGVSRDICCWCVTVTAGMRCAWQGLVCLQ